MKTENEAATPTSTPTPTYTTTQWATTSQIPIDPALQQQQPQHTTTTPYQHYQAYASHYPQATYGHYPYSAAVAPATASAQASSQAPQRPATTASATGGGVDSDIANLNDALGSAGVDLRAEEETLQKSHEQQTTYRSFEDRTRKQPVKPAFDTRFLGTTMRTIGTQHKITKVPDDSANYLALALRARLQDLVTAMIKASRHRTDAQFDKPASLYENGTPMWSIIVRSDVAKQLAALEKVEREEETRIRRERKERQDMAAAHAAALAAQANGTANPLATDGFDDMEGGVKKKRKKEGPGVTARNMSEDVRKKMSNAVATQAAGLGGKYAWMNASNAAAAANTTPKSKNATSTATSTSTSTATATATAATTATTATVTVAATGSPSPSTAASTSATTTAPATNANSSWARPYVSSKKTNTPQATAEEEETRTTVTMRDAMFVIENERGHGAGRGAARGWV